MSTGARFIAGVRNSFGNVAANVTYVGVMRYVTVTKLDLNVSGSRQKDAVGGATHMCMQTAIGRLQFTRLPVSVCDVIVFASSQISNNSKRTHTEREAAGTYL